MQQVLQELFYCFGNMLQNKFENNTWSLECNVKELQEILNGPMQGSMSIIMYLDPIVHAKCKKG